MVKNFDRLNTLKFSTVAPTAFTERGLYMLATILKGERAEKTTLAIIDTFVQVREPMEQRAESQAAACAIPSESKFSEAKAQYIVALIAEFAEHFGLTTAQAAKYLGRYKALELYDRQYGYLHTQSFASNVRDLSAYCRRMGGTL